MSHTAKDLRNLAKELGIRGYSTAKKARLVEMLEEHSRKSAPQEVAEPKESAPAPAPEPTPEPKEEAPKAAKKLSLWNQFLRDYRKEHGCTLKECMSKKDEYAAYKAKHQKKDE